jgi:predicted phosphoribosyltransferase
VSLAATHWRIVMRSRRRVLISRNTAPAHWRMIGSMSSHIFYSRDAAARGADFRAVRRLYQALPQVEGDEVVALLRDNSKQLDGQGI